ncbi:HAD family hydrolase [Kitasatospora sp. NPDC086801]|uniref:HAD family hydrolase n=1 Tax=Kitasatospora sp. NPDC086801 TaxID=3364066 RepID=UPI0038094349
MTVERINDWTPAAVVFDCDGTLMDTESHWHQARAEVLRGYGITAGAEFTARAAGLHYSDCGLLMAETAGDPSLAPELTDRLLASFRALVDADPVPMPGAAELVGRLSGFVPLAVASNCPRDVIETGLGGAGLLEHFEHIVVPAEGIGPKPAPDVYLTAARLCGAEPTDCLAVEDTFCGIRSAVLAGLRVIGVGPHPSAEAREAVDLWVATLSEPGLLDWVRRRSALALTS